MSYIGITGFMSRNEVEEALPIQMGSSKRLMVGVLASSKTLAGHVNSHPHRFPKIEDISSIFMQAPHALNLVHYSTDDRDTLADQLVRVSEFAGINCHGFQLNVRWPDPKQIESVYARIPVKMFIVLQIGVRAMNDVKEDPSKLVLRLRDYIGLVDTILIDPSGGLRREFDIMTAFEYLMHVRKVFPELGIGVAGGLSGNTVDRLVAPLVAAFPDLSWDAEGGLRDTKDRLDMEEVRAYLYISNEVARTYRKR